MSNKNDNLKIQPLRAALMTSRGLMNCALLLYALFYADTVSEILGPLAALIVCAVAALISVAVIPFFYMLINKFMSGAWGRYHLAIVIISLILPFVNALLWGFSKDSAFALNLTFTIIGLILLAVLSVTLSYVVYSVNTRLVLDEKKEAKNGLVFSALGFLIGAALAALTFWKLNAENMGYIVSIILLVTGLVIYFASYPYIPRFMRPLNKKVTLTGSYKAFFKTKKRSGVLTLSACFAAVAAVVTVVPLFAAQNSDTLNILFYSVAGAVFILSYCLLARSKNKGVGAIAGVILTVITCAALVILNRITLNISALVSVVTAAQAALTGLSCALVLNSALFKCDRIADLGIYTRGIALILKGMMVVSGFGLAISLTAAFKLIPVGAEIAAAATCAALVITFGILILLEKYFSSKAKMKENTKKLKESLAPLSEGEK